MPRFHAGVVGLLLSACLLAPACGGKSREPAVARGRELFHRTNPRYGCVECHGPDGGGIPNTGPSLRGIGDAYLKKFGGDRRKAHAHLVDYMKNPTSVGPTTERGRGITVKMPPYGALSKSDLDALAAYIMRLK